MAQRTGLFALWGLAMIIGITGSICSGKDTVAQMLVGKYCFTSYSLVEILRAEYDRSNTSIDTRQNLREFANGRRLRHGSQYYVAEALANAQGDGLTSSDNILIVGLYCKGEVDYLIDHLGGVLIGVNCNQGVDVRYERYIGRQEASLSPLTFDRFVEWDGYENGGTNDGETNVAHAMTRASFVLDNDGTLEDLLHRVDEVASTLRLQLCNPNFSCENLGVVDESYLENMRLQRNYEAFQFLKDHFSMKSLDESSRALAPLLSPAKCIRELGNQFGKRLVPAFLEPEVENAWFEFCKIEPSTTDEEMVMLTNRQEFGSLHRDLHKHLDSISNRMELDVKANIEEIKKHDRTQFQPGARRDIKTMRESGIEIRVLPEYFARLRELQRSSATSTMPLLEYLKNERMLEMNFINRSKVATIIHDALDHVWLYSLLHDKGVLAKYSELFESIGNPDKFDIFKREGEIVASIGYGVRYWANTTPGFRPSHSVEEMASKLDEYFEQGELEERHHDAYRHVRRLSKSPTLRESQSLAFVFSNYLVELDEQRRKHGTIKVRNKDMEILGELDCWSPDFLCYFIEAHRLLLDSKSKHRDNLLRAHLILEQHLSSEEATVEGNVLRIDADDLDKVDFSNINLPAERVMWMSRNYGFTAIRDRVYAA